MKTSALASSGVHIKKLVTFLFCDWVGRRSLGVWRLLSPVYLALELEKARNPFSNITTITISDFNMIFLSLSAVKYGLQKKTLTVLHDYRAGSWIGFRM